jgi:hypothetical protein
MGNFDEDIKRITEEVLSDGAVDKIIREKVQKGIEEAIDNSFRWGELEKAVKARVQSVLVPFIEGYDMSAYIVKLDTILTEIVNKTSLQDNKKILENFRYMMIEPESEEIKLSDIFKEYQNFVSRNMDTFDRKVTYETGEPEYEPMNVYLGFEEEEERGWSSFKSAILELSVDEEGQKDNLNRTVRFSRWKKDRKQGWEIRTDCNPEIYSLRNMDEFDLFLAKLQRADVHIIVDIDCDEECVYSDNKPELTYE